MVDQVKISMTASEFFELPESNLPAELINGEFIVSPTPIDSHQDAVGNIFVFLKQLNPSTGQARIAPLNVYLDANNVVQPDVFWISQPQSRCKLGEDGYWYGAPDLVIEVLSPGTAKRDKAEKFKLYEKHGVREYWIVDSVARYIEVWRLIDAVFVQQGVFEPGETFISVVLIGQSLDVTAILGG